MSTTIDYTRQRDWFDPTTVPSSVTVVGCGGIGSFTAFALAKLGVSKFTLVDPDIVEPHNLPNQMFEPLDVGETKVAALHERLVNEAGVNPANIVCLERRLEDGVPLSDVVISALDTMVCRKALWEQVRRQMACRLFLDGRLAGQNVVLYSANPMGRADIEGYEQTLYSDAEADGGSCTARSIIDVGFAVASLMTRAVRMHYRRETPTPVVYLNQATLDIYKGDWSCR